MLTIRNVGRIPHTFKPSKPSYDSSTFPQARGRKIRPALKDMAHRNTVDGLNLSAGGKEKYPEKKYIEKKVVSIQVEWMLAFFGISIYTKIQINRKKSRLFQRSLTLPTGIRGRDPLSSRTQMLRE